MRKVKRQKRQQFGKLKKELSIDAKIDKLLFIHHNPAQVYEFKGRDEYFYDNRFYWRSSAGGLRKSECMKAINSTQWVSISEMKNMPNLYPKEAKGKLIELLSK